MRHLGYCKSTSLTLGGYDSLVDFYALPLGGCDIVLGV